MPQAGNPAMGMGPNAVQQRQQQVRNLSLFLGFWMDG